MNFTIYSKDGCPFCQKIKTVLESLTTNGNVSIVSYELGIDFTPEEFYSQFGKGSTFPQIIMNGENHLGGCVDTIKYLQENNIL